MRPITPYIIAVSLEHVYPSLPSISKTAETGPEEPIFGFLMSFVALSELLTIFLSWKWRQFQARPSVIYEGAAAKQGFRAVWLFMYRGSISSVEFSISCSKYPLKIWFFIKFKPSTRLCTTLANLSILIVFSRTSIQRSSFLRQPVGNYITLPQLLKKTSSCWVAFG